MPRVVERTSEGCLVKGQIFGSRGGDAVSVTLERPCVWHGSLVPKAFAMLTDAQGRFELRLPPTEELRAQDGSETPLYRFNCDRVGTWLFSVPTQDMWTLS